VAITADRILALKSTKSLVRLIIARIMLAELGLDNETKAKPMGESKEGTGKSNERPKRTSDDASDELKSAETKITIDGDGSQRKGLTRLK
jgi:hypothetical protein